MVGAQEKQRLFTTTFWRGDFVGSLDRDTRHFYIYLITSPESNISGIYKSSYRLFEFDDGWTKDEADHHFKILSEAGKAFFFDGWVIIPKLVEHHQWEEYDNKWNSVAHLFLKAPKPVRLHALLNGYPWDFILNRVSDRYNGERRGSIEYIKELQQKTPLRDPSEALRDPSEALRDPSEALRDPSEALPKPFDSPSEALRDPSEHINLNLNLNSNSSKTKNEEGTPSAEASPPAPFNGSGLSDLSDPLANGWQEALSEISPVSTWGNIGRERKACVSLGQNTARLWEDGPPYESPEETIEALIAHYLELRKTKRGWWQDAPVTPTEILKRWSELVTSLAESYRYSEEVVF
jgi:hypothetical protein